MPTEDVLFALYLDKRKEVEDNEAKLSRSRQELQYLENMFLEYQVTRYENDYWKLSASLTDRAYCSDNDLLKEFLLKHGLDPESFFKKREVKSRDLAMALRKIDNIPPEIMVRKLLILTLRAKNKKEVE